MAALDFPNSPTVGATYTGPNGAVYTWDGAAWTVSGVLSTGTAAGGDLTGTYPNPTVGAQKVSTAKLVPGATLNTSQTATLPAGFAGSATAWATVLSMPAITTRGGIVLAIVSGGWSSKVPSNTDCSAQVRWLRNPGSVVLTTLIHAMNASSSGLGNFPLPPLICLEQPAAGTWTYIVQYQLAGASFLATPSSGAGQCWVVEFA